MSRLLNGSAEKPHAMITGASRGIGVYIAHAFARRGYNLTLVARSQSGLEKTKHLLRKSDVEVVTLPADLSVAAERIRLVEEAISKNGPIDVLVNNAGLYQPGLLEERSDEEIESEIQLNLNALIFLSKAVLPGMKTRGRGLIVNMSSLAGLVGAAYSEVYSATKHGVVGFTRALRATLEQEGIDGVRVVAVCPGYVSEVGMFQGYQEAYDIDAPKWMGTSHPDAVAAAVLDALDNDSPEIVVNPGPIRLGLSLSALFPRWMERLYLKLGAHKTLRPLLAPVSKEKVDG